MALTPGPHSDEERLRLNCLDSLMITAITQFVLLSCTKVMDRAHEFDGSILTLGAQDPFATESQRRTPGQN